MVPRYLAVVILKNRNVMKTIVRITFLSLLFVVLGCSKDDDQAVLVKSEQKQLTSFVFDADNNEVLQSNITATVDEGAKAIRASVASGTDVTALTPTINTSAKAKVSPTGPQNFSSPVTYTVTAEDGTTVNYVVRITVSQSSESELISFAFLKIDNGTDENIVGIIDNDTKEVYVVTKANTDLVALLPELQISEGASYSPQGIQDFTEPVTYTITAADGTKNDITVTVQTERDLLIAIAEANPNSTLEWNYEETDLDDWSGVDLDDQGYVRNIEIDDGSISVLPEEIGFFQKLQYLDVEESGLIELPKSIGNLSNLITLELDKNSLTELPAEFAKLASLNHLYLGKNLFKEFPKELFQLTNLIELELNLNLIEELPSGFSQMTALYELNLDDNQFTEFPQELFGLPNLVRLRYSRNGLKEVPQGIDNLNQLERLYLNDNLLSDLPDELYALNKLQTLMLNANQFEYMPEVLFYLEELTRLQLNNNKIAEIPITIALSPSLRILEIDDNLLTALPKEMGSKMSLTTLSIRGNPIAILPNEICERFEYFDYFLGKDDTTICK